MTEATKDEKKDPAKTEDKKPDPKNPEDKQPEAPKEVDSMLDAYNKEVDALKKSEGNFTTFGELKPKDIFKFKGVPYGHFRLAKNGYMDARDGCQYKEPNATRIVELLS